MESLSESKFRNDIRRHIGPPLEHIRYAAIPGCHLGHTVNGHLCFFLQHFFPFQNPAFGERLGKEFSSGRVRLGIALREQAGLGGFLARDDGVPWRFDETRADLVDFFDRGEVVDGHFGWRDADNGT